MVYAVKKVGLVANRLSLVMRTHTRTMIIPLKILRIIESISLLSHKLLNALINELSQIRRFKLLLFAKSIDMRS